MTANYNYLPIIIPWCLFLISAFTQPPEWLKPRNKARKLWVQTHLLAVLPATIIAVALQTHPLYANNIPATAGASILTYMYIQSSWTDMQYRKASESHLMHGWSLFVVTAALYHDANTVASSLAALFLTALMRRWWAGDATALCVAVTCVSPILMANPDSMVAFGASMLFVVITALITAVLSSSKKPIKIPLIPIALAPFLLMPAIYMLTPAMVQA